MLFGVEFTYKIQHIISGKHGQELYGDFYMPPKASECVMGWPQGRGTIHTGPMLMLAGDNGRRLGRGGAAPTRGLTYTGMIQGQSLVSC